MTTHTLGQPVTVAQRGQHGTDTWHATYLRPAAGAWCDVKREGKTFRVPARLVISADRVPARLVGAAERGSAT